MEPSRIMRRVAGPVFAVGLLVTAACGDGPGRTAGDVAGTWALVADSAGAVLVRVSSQEVEVLRQDDVTTCFHRTLYEIVEIDRTEFRLTDQQDTFSVNLRRDGDQLVIDAFGEAATYAQSDVDPATLPLCPPPDPGAPCGSLIGLSVGLSIEGMLQALDSANSDGSRYDLYRLELAAQTDVLIGMSSTEVDSYLLLFDQGGGILLENDDASDLTLDAELETTLAPGCWIIMATSAGADAFGSYDVSVSNPE